MAKNIDWQLYRSFLSVLTQGSLSAAARHLDIAQPTVGRHIVALERALDVVLFIRTQNGFQPTEAAVALQPHAEQMASLAAAMERTASNNSGEMTGTVRVTASEIIGAEVLPPILARLNQQHPKVTIELLLSNRVQDLLNREADIAVRMVQPKQTQLIARLVGTTELGLHASTDYINRQGKPKTLNELNNHTLIGFDQPTEFIREALKKQPWISRDKFSFCSDSDLVQLALIRAGAGIGFCQVNLVKDSSKIKRLFSDQVKMHLDMWVTMHEDLRHNKVCKTAFDVLAENLLVYNNEV